MGNIREIPIRGEKTEMFTTVTVKRGMGGVKIESKGLSETRGTGMSEATPTTFYIFFPFLT